jgi:hypothetical protein
MVILSKLHFIVIWFSLYVPYSLVMDYTQSKDIHFVVKPLYYVSKVLGMIVFKTGSANKCANKERCFVPELILPVFMIISMCVHLCFDVLYTIQFTGLELTLDTRVMWIVNKIVSSSTSIVTLLLNLTINRHCIPRILSYIHDVDIKLFRADCRDRIFRQARSSIIVQLTVAVTITALENILFNFVFPPNAPLGIMHLLLENLSAAINRVMTLQYINLVLSLKQRYKYMNYLLSEPLTENETMKAKHSNEEGSICQSCKPIMLNAAFKPNFNNSNYIINSIHDLRILYNQLHDTLLLINRHYGIPILLYTISTLTCCIPAFYHGIVTLQNIICSYGDSKRYLEGALFLCLCVTQLLFFLWLIVCCHITGEEVSETLVYVHKLLLYPDTGHRINSELHSFCSLLRDVRVEFNVCGCFTLNLPFLCCSLSIVFTYALVLIQLNLT